MKNDNPYNVPAKHEVEIPEGANVQSLADWCRGAGKCSIDSAYRWLKEDAFPEIIFRNHKRRMFVVTSDSGSVRDTKRIAGELDVLTSGLEKLVNELKITRQG